MGENSKIEWTTHTFNCWRGCTKISPGCQFCYAETLSHRNPKVLGVWGDQGTRVVASEAAWKGPPKWDREAAKAGERRRVFCASLADVFEDRPELVAPRSRLWQLILYTHSLDWLLLTKRPGNVIPLLKRVWEYQKDRLLRDDCLAAWIDGSHPPDNVWLGCSVEDQARADERIPELLQTPAAVRFLSVEPLLGSIDLADAVYDRCRICRGLFSDREDCRCGDCSGVRGSTGVDWVIVGGESGPHARPMSPDWVRSLRDQCQSAGVPFFFKQWGEWLPISETSEEMCDRLYDSIRKAKPGEDQGALDEIHGRRCRVETRAIGFDGQSSPPEYAGWGVHAGHATYQTFRLGKKTAGRTLDGKVWDEFPRARSAVAP